MKKNSLYQCSWCGMYIHNDVDAALHVFTTHYHIDAALPKRESKRILRRATTLENKIGVFSAN